MNGAPTRVFIARLAGIAVFDPIGDQVGRIRDVVVSLRLSGEPPRVLGFVVEMQPRRRVFLPITRVTTIDPGAVIFTGKINMRRFQQRSTETLVIGELLDRTVQFRETDEDVTVSDVAMESTRTRDWVVSKVAVRRRSHGRGLRRRHGETIVVGWDAVTGFSVIEEGQGAASLLAAFEDLRAADLAHVVHELSPKRRVEVAIALDDERLADILEELSEKDQIEIVGMLEQERAARVLEAMGPDDAADLLAALPEDQAEGLLKLMEPEEADPVRRLLVYPENTAGGVMTTEVVILPPDAAIAEALAHVRSPELTPALASQVYVCRPPTETPTGRYLGMAHFQRLLREQPSAIVGGAADTDVDPLRPGVSLPGVARYLATYNLAAAPIVDEHGHLLGAVTVDDVLDHMLPEGWRDNAADGVVPGDVVPGDERGSNGQ
ncbi:MAG: magnesium transporter MgtE N-terminal domain-containing protein [Streptosporangiaceae bacterium]